MITLSAAARVGQSGNVLAFEPNPDARARLVEHVEMNQLRNVRVFDSALGESAGTATLSTATARTGTGTLRALESALTAHHVSVARLDDVLADIPTGNNVFLKIDTEGYDFSVLKGAPQLLSRPNVTVFAEVNHKWLRELGQSAEEMFAYMSQFGFKAFLPRLGTRFLRRELRLEPLILPGPHHWFNAVFLRDAEALTHRLRS
jgi:FkbM family methyltransferase